MKRQDFHFNLSESQIAQFPLDVRSDSRLLHYQCSTKQHTHQQFKSIADLLQPGDLLVFNNTKVIPARLLGHKSSGGKVELLVERILTPTDFWAHIKASKAPKTNTLIHLDKGLVIEVIGRDDDLFLCRASNGVDDLLHQVGHVPLPPYINRKDETLDLDRYQTVYAQHKGSVAAPTAGLHFDEQVLASLQQKGINRAFVTLHVGAGTFRPLRCDDLRDHKMHREFFSINEDLCAAVNTARAIGGRVIAVGTTALRSLESAADKGHVTPCSRDTDIFIYPGYEFQVCDGLITNFHLPESTLLMLVAAFIGYQEAMALYQVAIEENYRFFSYGDASLLL